MGGRYSAGFPALILHWPAAILEAHINDSTTLFARYLGNAGAISGYNQQCSLSASGVVHLNCIIWPTLFCQSMQVAVACDGGGDDIYIVAISKYICTKFPHFVPLGIFVVHLRVLCPHSK